MSEGKKRRVHSAEFKAKVGLEAVRGGEDGDGDRAGIRRASGAGGPVEEGDPGERRRSV
jgi:hypothetical protein